MTTPVDVYIGIALGGYGLLVATCLACLSLGTHRSVPLRVFILLATLLGIIRIADDLFYYSLAPGADAVYILISFVLYTPPTIYLAMFALVCRAWAVAYFSVFDSRKLRLINAAFAAGVAFSVVLQALYALSPLVDVLNCVVVAIHHGVEAALNIGMAGFFVFMHRRVARVLRPLEGGGGGAGGIVSDQKQPMLPDNYSDSSPTPSVVAAAAAARAGSAGQRHRLTFVSYLCTTGLVLHAVTVVYIAYLVWKRAEEGPLREFEDVINSVTFDVALTYEVAGPLAFLYITKLRGPVR